MTATARTRERVWMWAAVAIWALMCVLSVGRASLYHRRDCHRGCYPVFADGGRHWFHGEPLFDADHPDTAIGVFRYSPLLAVGMVPMGLLPDPMGSACLRALSLLVFLGGLGWWSRTAAPASWTARPRALLFLLCASMVLVSAMDVQLNLLTIGFMMMAIAAAAEERWSTAALALALACCLKAYPIALGLTLSVTFPRRFPGRLLAALALCLVLPFLFQHPTYVLQQYQDWFRYGLNARGAMSNEHHFYDARFLIHRWMFPIDAAPYALLQMGTGAAIAAICLLQRRSSLSTAAACNCALGLCVGWMMAFGPSTEATTYVQLAPPVAAAMVLAWTLTNPAWYRLLVSTSCLILTLTQLQMLLPLHNPLHGLAAHPFAAVVFMAAVAVRGLGDLRTGKGVDFATDLTPLQQAA